MRKHKNYIGLITGDYRNIFTHFILFTKLHKKFHPNTLVLPLVVVASLLSSACTMTNFHGGIEPLYPEAGNPVYADTVPSLTPTFTWKSVLKDPHTYDLAIWDVGNFAQKGMLFMTAYIPTGSKSPGPQVYLKENIASNEHTVEVALAPDTLYLWSIRTRQGDQVSNWARYDYKVYWTDSSESGENWYYLFKTPEVSQQ